MRKLFLFLLFLFLAVPVYAAGTGTENGIPYIRLDVASLKGKSAAYFTDYTFGTQAVYNESGSTTATSGMVDFSDYTTKAIGVSVTNISGAGTLTLNINGYVGTTGTSCIISTLTYATTTTYCAAIAPYCQYLSIDGAASTGTITASVWVDAVENTK